jgi:hypothetical protein
LARRKIKKKAKKKNKMPAVYLTAERGENEIFHWVGVFSSRQKKT